MVSLNVIAPQFSIAPEAKSGIAIKSNLGKGYFIPKYFSYDKSSFFPSSREYLPFDLFPFVVITRTCVLPILPVRYSNSPTPR